MRYSLVRPNVATMPRTDRYRTDRCLISGVIKLRALFLPLNAFFIKESPQDPMDLLNAQIKHTGDYSDWVHWRDIAIRLGCAIRAESSVKNSLLYFRSDCIDSHITFCPSSSMWPCVVHWITLRILEGLFGLECINRLVAWILAKGLQYGGTRRICDDLRQMYRYLIRRQFLRYNERLIEVAEFHA